MICKLQTARPIPRKYVDVTLYRNWMLGSCTTCAAPLSSSHWRPLPATLNLRWDAELEVPLVSS